jgi:hypothetical protein
MKYEDACQLSPPDFKRRFGVQRKTFEDMLDVLQTAQPSQPMPGQKPKLTCGEQLLVALEYWREYRTYFHIACDWGISEATVCRIVRRVEKNLMNSGKFRIAGKKRLYSESSYPDVVLLDVTETPIERPKCHQGSFYSGKKKQHSLKLQLVIDQATGEIICLSCGAGRCHDFALFKASGVHMHPEIASIQDSGYQGIAAYHANSYVPKKKPKDGELSSLERQYNRALGRERIGIEHVNRRLKVFKILSGRYRNRRRRYGLRCNLLAAIYNYELEIKAA